MTVPPTSPDPPVFRLICMLLRQPQRSLIQQQAHDLFPTLLLDRVISRIDRCRVTLCCVVIHLTYRRANF